jgi:hypothetical protein
MSSCLRFFSLNNNRSNYRASSFSGVDPAREKISSTLTKYTTLFQLSEDHIQAKKSQNEVFINDYHGLYEILTKGYV